jgi:putative endonuclease
MYHFVCIIYSSQRDVYYKGYSTNPERRLFEHNNGFSRYIKNKGSWQMVCLEELPDKRSALIREKQVKKYMHEYIGKLIGQPQNLVK